MFGELDRRSINAENVDGWLAEWTRLADLTEESFWRLYIDKSANTADAEALRRYEWFTQEVQPGVQSAENRLKRKLLESGVKPQGFDVPLRKLRTEAALFREENLPLLAREKQLASDYNAIAGAQTAAWNGEQKTLYELRAAHQDADVAERQELWHLINGRRMADREAINNIWKKLLALRREIAAHAELPDYGAYRWQQLFRFDYTPEDCTRFREAILEVVVPAATRIYERRRSLMALDATAHPWELGVDPMYPWVFLGDALDRPPIKAFDDVDTLISRVGTIFGRLDARLGDHFDVMRQAKLLDLDSRPHKAPGAWCTSLAVARRPFILMNAVGLHEDVMTLLHESGHAFHWCEAYAQPYFQQRGVEYLRIEFEEGASMTMEYVSAPYLPESEEGCYSAEDTARARIEHLESAILFWPFMAVMDGFQHWAYTQPDQAADPDQCDGQWASLWRTFIPGLPWNEDEAILRSGWQPKAHLFDVPFYYIEYGLAQLGAVQIWRRSLDDPGGALAGYRRALALGGTASLPDLYTAAGARFSLGADALREAVGLMEATMERLSKPGWAR